MDGNGKALKANGGRRIRLGTVAVLAIGAFLVLSGALAVNAWQQSKKRDVLESDIARLGEAVQREPSLPIGPSGKMKEAQERLERASELFPADLKQSAALESILQVSSSSDVQVAGVQEKPPTKQVIGEHVYYVWPFSLKVEGAPENLFGLVARFEGMEAGPVVLQKVVLNNNRTRYVASLDLAFYTRSRTETVPTPAPQKPDKPKEKRVEK